MSNACKADGLRNIAAYSHASLVTDGVRTALQSVSQHIVHQVQLYIDTFLCHYSLRSTSPWLVRSRPRVAPAAAPRIASRRTDQPQLGLAVFLNHCVCPQGTSKGALPAAPHSPVSPGGLSFAPRRLTPPPGETGRCLSLRGSALAVAHRLCSLVNIRVLCTVLRQLLSDSC